MIHLPPVKLEHENDPAFIEQHTCPYCGLPVVINTDARGRVHDSPAYLLVADWVYHSACWDQQVEEHPPAPGHSLSLMVNGTLKHPGSASQLQQTPVPRGGGIIKYEW